jgi:group I intron endonuclease
LKNGTHRNNYLQRAFDKHGKEAFVFEVLEEVNNHPNDYLLEREQFWIDELLVFNPIYGYNLNPRADNCAGRLCSLGTKEKLRIANLGKKQSQETCEKISKKHRGRKFSSEHRAKISEANRRRVISDKTRQAMSDAKKGISLPVETRRKMSESHKKL